MSVLKVDHNGKTPQVVHDRAATRKGVNAEIWGEKRCFVKEVDVGYIYDPATKRLTAIKATVDSRS